MNEAWMVTCYNEADAAFGYDPGFPYQNTYVIVMADTEHEAVEKFRAKFPDRHTNLVNCAFWYPEERWHGSRNEAFYGDPVEIIK